jgi:hypothetical protein
MVVTKEIQGSGPIGTGRKKIFCCEKCGKEFEYRDKAFRHESWCGDCWACNCCGEEFETENLVVTHSKVCAKFLLKKAKASERRRKDVEDQRKIAEEDKLRKKRAQMHQTMREKASEREKALDYDSAIEIWEELGEIEEAARVRKLKARQGSVRVAQKVVKGDEITRTEIKDSVVSKSSIGAGGKSKAEEIKEIKELLDSGAIDESEFKQMKKEILGK